MPRIDQLSHELRLDKNEILAICAKLNISAISNSNISNNQAKRIRDAARKQALNPELTGEATTALTANPSKKQETANFPNHSKPTIALTANPSKPQDEEILGELLKMEERAKIAEERVKTIESDLSNREAALAKRQQAVAEKEAIALNGFKELEAATRQEWAIQKEQEINAQREQIVKEANREAKTILDAAQKEADKIVEQAEALANEHRHRARQQTIQEIQASVAQLETRTRQLDAKEQSIDAKESNTRTLDSKLRRQEQELEEENIWIANEKKKLRQKEEELLARERACSEEAIARVSAQ